MTEQANHHLLVTIEGPIMTLSLNRPDKKKIGRAHV